MNATAIAALVIVVTDVVLLVLLFQWMCRQDKKAVEEVEETGEPETPLARLVLEAHTANQVLELAITTGTREEIDTALNDMIYHSNALMTHLYRMTKDEGQR